MPVQPSPVSTDWGAVRCYACTWLKTSFLGSKRERNRLRRDRTRRVNRGLLRERDAIRYDGDRLIESLLRISELPPPLVAWNAEAEVRSRRCRIHQEHSFFVLRLLIAQGDNMPRGDTTRRSWFASSQQSSDWTVTTTRGRGSSRCLRHLLPTNRVPAERPCQSAIDQSEAIPQPSESGQACLDDLT